MHSHAHGLGARNTSVYATHRGQSPAAAVYGLAHADVLLVDNSPLALLAGLAGIAAVKLQADEAGGGGGGSLTLAQLPADWLRLPRDPERVPDGDGGAAEWNASAAVEAYGRAPDRKLVHYDFPHMLTIGDSTDRFAHGLLCRGCAAAAEGADRRNFFDDPRHWMCDGPLPEQDSAEARSGPCAFEGPPAMAGPRACVCGNGRVAAMSHMCGVAPAGPHYGKCFMALFGTDPAQFPEDTAPRLRQTLRVFEGLVAAQAHAAQAAHAGGSDGGGGGPAGLTRDDADAQLPAGPAPLAVVMLQSTYWDILVAPGSLQDAAASHSANMSAALDTIEAWVAARRAPTRLQPCLMMRTQHLAAHGKFPEDVTRAFNAAVRQLGAARGVPVFDWDLAVQQIFMPGEGAYPLDEASYPGGGEYLCDASHQRDCVADALLLRLRQFIAQHCGM